MTPTPRTDAESEYVLSADMSGEIEIVRAPFARELERELADAREQVAILRSDQKRLSEFAKTYRLRADEADDKLAAVRLERELEQERQDRKQADLDTIRALGERNSARAEVRLLGEQLKANP